jgi:hypothetical protein
MLFIINLLIIFSMIFAYRIYGEVVLDDVRNATKDWIKCYLVDAPQALFTLGKVITCPARPAHLPNVALYNCLHFSIGSQGMFCFLIYGTETEQCNLWAMCLGCKKKKTQNSDQGQTRGTTRAASMAPGGSRKGTTTAPKLTLGQPGGDRSRENSRTGREEPTDTQPLNTGTDASTGTDGSSGGDVQLASNNSNVYNIPAPLPPTDGPLPPPPFQSDTV